MYIDSHCHLNYLDDPQQALLNARAAGVTTCLCIGVEQTTIDEVLTFAQQHDDVWASVGEHPGSCSGDASWVADYLNAPRVVAVGEIGLDYLHTTDDQDLEKQRHTFKQQMEIARNTQLPVIVHTRAAQEDTLAIMAEFPEVAGVLHCFTESWEMAAQAIEMGYYISISGIVTFNNADNVREVARQIPIDRLLIETDAPWLAPKPMRGKQNEPAYVAHTAEFLAKLRGTTPTQLAEQTTNNFKQLFEATA